MASYLFLNTHLVNSAHVSQATCFLSIFVQHVLRALAILLVFPCLLVELSTVHQCQTHSAEYRLCLPPTDSMSPFSPSPTFQWKNWAKQTKNTACILQHLRNEDHNCYCCRQLLLSVCSQLNVWCMYYPVQSSQWPHGGGVINQVYGWDDWGLEKEGDLAGSSVGRAQRGKEPKTVWPPSPPSGHGTGLFPVRAPEGPQAFPSPGPLSQSLPLHLRAVLLQGPPRCLFLHVLISHNEAALKFRSHQKQIKENS